MANFTPSALLAGQAKFLENMTRGEWRLPDVAALGVANKSEIANPMLTELRGREDRSIYAYFPIRQAAINGTARAHNHTGARGDSVQETISWSTFSEPFSISIKQADNNIFSFDEMYASTLRNSIFNLMARVDAWFVAALVADRTQVNVGGGNGTFNATDDVYEVPVDEKDYFYQNARATLEENLFMGQIVGVVDSSAYVIAERLRAQGSANATNFGFQFDGMDIVKTTRTVLGTSTYGGSGMFFNPGLVAAIPWIPKQNRKALNAEKAMSYIGDYGQIDVPELGAPIAIHMYADRADTSSAGGYTQDVVLQGEVSIDFGYSSVLSTFRGANDSVVYGVGQLKV